MKQREATQGGKVQHVSSSTGSASISECGRYRYSLERRIVGIDGPNRCWATVEEELSRLRRAATELDQCIGDVDPMHAPETHRAQMALRRALASLSTDGLPPAAREGGVMASVDQALDTANFLAREVESLRRDVERLTRERDAAYAAALRSDEVHAEAMRAVRARAERAEAQVATHLESLETYEDRIREIAYGALGYQDPTTATIVLLDALERDYHRQRIARTQAELHVDRLMVALRALESCVVWCDSTQSYWLYQRVRDVLDDARAALADATVRKDDPDAPNERR